jgi:hypothetical protein
MKATQFLLAVALGLFPTLALGAGLARSDNFLVMADDEATARDVLARAEQYRREVAEEWLGEELPPSIGQSVLNVEISDAEDDAHTWVLDNLERKYHRVWVTGSRQQVTGGMLRHEITHVVMATRYPQGLPLWAEEGAASLSDDARRIEIRRQIIRWYARTGNWPYLTRVFDTEALRSGDRETYAIAASVTEYLLSRGDKATFLQFATSGREDGWDSALDRYYGIRSVDELSAAWRRWAADSLATARTSTSSELVAVRRPGPQ